MITNNVDRKEDLVLVCNDDKTSKLVVPNQFDEDGDLGLGTFPVDCNGFRVGGSCVIMSRDQIMTLVSHLNAALNRVNCDV